MSEYRIKQIGAEDFSVLIPLMKDCFGMEVNIDYFHWKYIDNPAGSFLGFIAIHNTTEEVGAYYGVIPQKLFIEGIERTIFQSCDTMTHSAHRRKGLFKMLALACYEHLRSTNQLFIIGYGGADSTPGFLKFGWKHVFNFRYSFVPNLLCKLKGWPGLYKPEHFSNTPSEIMLNTVLKNIPTLKTIHSARTSEHILWRTKNNNYTYEFVFYKNTEQCDSYAIYYIHNNNLILFDFFFATPKSKKAILWQLSRQVSSKKLKGIIAYCQENGSKEKELRKSLFLYNPFKKGPLSERTPFIFYSDEETIQKYNLPAQWSMTSYDHDAL
ncbi:MAG TPA: GNAT family N-acetyltransferase [Ferruginibacter sp.]|nr:GNAT family N-acetyltransferase [Ferruginibacter sp.]HRE63047.1 GNAT family N-acetyltransferase [Ferruginibacter sp.]